jgi:hypothetical protein
VVTDPRIRRLPLTGSADQFTDSTDAAGDLGLMRACAAAVITCREDDVRRADQ